MEMSAVFSIGRFMRGGMSNFVRTRHLKVSVI